MLIKGAAIWPIPMRKDLIWVAFFNSRLPFVQISFQIASFLSPQCVLARQGKNGYSEMVSKAFWRCLQPQYILRCQCFIIYNTLQFGCERSWGGGGGEELTWECNPWSLPTCMNPC